MYKSSWGWTLGCSKHVEDNIIKLNLYWKKCAFFGFFLHMSVVVYYVSVTNQIFRGQFHAWRVDFDYEITLLVYPSIYQLRRWSGHGARMGEGRGLHRVLVGKPEGKRPLGRPRRRWEGNIKMDLQEVEGGCGDWMELAQDRERWRALLSKVMNFRVP